MKRIVLTIAALVVASLSFAQEYLVVENKAGGFSRFDVDMITKASFKSFAAEGQGTEASPFNVAAANQKCKEIGETPSTEKYYIKGTLLGLYRSYGTSVASFYIADDESGINRIFVNEVGTPIPVTDMKAGDEIIIYGSLYSYNNLTPEIIPQQIVSYNGEKYEIVEPSGTGTADDPYNVSGVIAAMQDLAKGAVTTEDIYVKAYVAQVDLFTANYGNITYYICDLKNGMSQRFYVYRGLGLGGAKFTSENDLQKGDEVVICGKITNYNGTLEYAQGNYLVKLNDQTAGGGGQGDSYSYDFIASGLGDWTIIDKNKPAEIENIWKYNSRYGMVATGYASGTNYASESWVVSPEITLGDVQTLTLNHAINFFTDAETAKTQAILAISEDGTTWTDLTLTNWPTTLSWTYVDSTVDVSAYANKKVYIALKYISTSEKAGTWEVGKITVE